MFIPGSRSPTTPSRAGPRASWLLYHLSISIYICVHTDLFIHIYIYIHIYILYLVAVVPPRHHARVLGRFVAQPPVGLAVVINHHLLKKGNVGLGLKVPCAPKWFDFESPLIKTTKPLVQTRSGTRAKRIYP